MPAPATSWSVTFQTCEDFEAQVAEVIQLQGDELSKALGEAFVHLYRYPWDHPIASDFYSVYGSSFIYRVRTSYLLAFDLKVDRDTSGRLEKVVLRLKAIQKG